MKNCKQCNVEKPYSEYYKRKDCKDGYLGMCKSCVRIKNKKHYQEKREDLLEYYQGNKEKYSYHRDKHKDGLQHVYTVGNYAGVTSNPKIRKVDHKSKGRDVSNFRVIYSAPRS